MLPSDSAEAREFHRIIRASVRECVETWRLQTEAAPPTVEALETIVARAAVPILRQLENHLPQLSRAFAPSVVGVMLQAFFEAMRD